PSLAEMPDMQAQDVSRKELNTLRSIKPYEIEHNAAKAALSPKEQKAAAAHMKHLGQVGAGFVAQKQAADRASPQPKEAQPAQQATTSPTSQKKSRAFLAKTATMAREVKNKTRSAIDRVTGRRDNQRSAAQDRAQQPRGKTDGR
ncbi:MAG: hypothetical protein KDE46_23740, partial [Caldilineaceae bacterium]|nr:hypothetical protein [Caldilineaceae bacterium]